MRSCVKCGVKAKILAPCSLSARYNCNGLLCMDCISEVVGDSSADISIAICPICELAIAEELEEEGLYYQEDGALRTIDAQLWKISFRVVGTRIFKGLCAEKIFEVLKSQLRGFQQ